MSIVNNIPGYFLKKSQLKIKNKTQFGVQLKLLYIIIYVTCEGLKYFKELLAKKTHRASKRQMHIQCSNYL